MSNTFGYYILLFFLNGFSHWIKFFGLNYQSHVLHFCAIAIYHENPSDHRNKHCLCSSVKVPPKKKTKLSALKCLNPTLIRLVKRHNKK